MEQTQKLGFAASSKGHQKELVTTRVPNVCTATSQPSTVQLELVALFHPEIQFDLKEHLIATFPTTAGTVKQQIRAEHKQTLHSRKAENQLIIPRLYRLPELVLSELSYQEGW